MKSKEKALNKTNSHEAYTCNIPATSDTSDTNHKNDDSFCLNDAIPFPSWYACPITEERPDI